jgi:hypothetical protein
MRKPLSMAAMILEHVVGFMADFSTGYLGIQTELCN